MEIDSDWSKQKPRDLPPRAHRINCRTVISSNYLPGNLKLNFVFCFFFFWNSNNFMFFWSFCWMFRAWISHVGTNYLNRYWYFFPLWYTQSFTTYWSFLVDLKSWLSRYFLVQYLVVIALWTIQRFAEKQLDYYWGLLANVRGNLSGFSVGVVFAAYGPC